MEVEEDITGDIFHPKTDMEDMTGEILHLLAEDLIIMMGRLEDMRDSPLVGLTGVGMGIMTDPLLDLWVVTALVTMTKSSSILVGVLLPTPR